MCAHHFRSRSLSLSFSFHLVPFPYICALVYIHDEIQFLDSRETEQEREKKRKEEREREASTARSTSRAHGQELKASRKISDDVAVEKEKELKCSSAWIRKEGREVALRCTRTRRLYRATHVQLRDTYSECTKYTQYSCMRSRPRIYTCMGMCVRARNVDRVRDRACACTDALHNIFAIVKCKVPRGRGGCSAEPAFPCIALARSLARLLSAHSSAERLCESGKDEGGGQGYGGEGTGETL